MFEQGIRLQHCHNCSALTRFESRGSYPDGSCRVICTTCNNNGGVLHRCPHSNPFEHHSWLPLVMLGIDIVCPRCKAAYDLGIKIEPAFPDLGKVLQVGGVVIGAAVLIGVGVEIAQEIKRALSA